MNKFVEPLQKFLADLPEPDEDDIVAGNSYLIILSSCGLLLFLSIPIPLLIPNNQFRQTPRFG